MSKYFRKRKPFPTAAVVAAYKAGGSLRAIGAEYGYTYEAIRLQLAKAGVMRRPPGRPWPWEPGERERALRAIELYKTGLPLVEVGRQLGVNHTTIRLHMLELGATMRAAYERPRTGAST